MIVPAFTGVDGQTSMLFGYASGSQAILTCTSAAQSPTRAAIVGTDARIEIDGNFYTPTTFTLIPRLGKPFRFAQPHPGRGLWHEADEVARCLRERLGERIFVIAHTGYGQPEDRRRALASGCDVHLVKPVDVRDLCGLIASLPPTHLSSPRG